MTEPQPSGDNRSPQAMFEVILIGRKLSEGRCYEQKEHFHLLCEIPVSNLIITQGHTFHT